MEENGTSTGCLSASFKSEKDCLAAYEQMRNHGAMKRWEKDLTFRFKAESIEQLKTAANEMYNMLKPMCGFREAELDIQQTMLLH